VPAAKSTSPHRYPPSARLLAETTTLPWSHGRDARWRHTGVIATEGRLLFTTWPEQVCSRRTRRSPRRTHAERRVRLPDSGCHSGVDGGGAAAAVPAHERDEAVRERSHQCLGHRLADRPADGAAPAHLRPGGNLLPARRPRDHDRGWREAEQRDR